MALDNFIHTNMFDEHLLGGRDFVSPALFDLMNQTSCEVERSGTVNYSSDPFAQLLPNFHLNSSTSHNRWNELQLHPCIDSPTILADDHLHQRNSVLSFGGNGCNYPCLRSLTSSSSTSSSMLSFDHLENCRSISNSTRLVPLSYSRPTENILDPNTDINSVQLSKEDLIMEEQLRWLYSAETTNSIDADKVQIRENDDGLLGATLKRPYMVINFYIHIDHTYSTNYLLKQLFNSIWLIHFTWSGHWWSNAS